MKKKKPVSEIDAAIAEDPMIEGLLKARGKKVEVIAFGICYAGLLDSVDVDLGTIVIIDADDRAMLEFERIEAFSVLG
ncbi:MAG: hypothetical protein HY540_00540 [Deltaproteobacteria bacterium]|nr:hypothetical protein [Deltaproteobacteria bacterium]